MLGRKNITILHCLVRSKTEYDTGLLVENNLRFTMTNVAKAVLF